jgi:BirA family biotin operon repressor/biotin-[acetyl-CoA-carboxylase] ligase
VGAGHGRIGRRIAVWNRVGSTNDLAARAAGSAANDGLVVLAEEQTAGRGRRGQDVVGPPGVVPADVRAPVPPALPGRPGLADGAGGRRGRRGGRGATGSEARIKWPNDVRVGGRKIAGILVERGTGAVLGIGLNGDVAAEDFPDELRATATSLGILSGRPVDRSELARSLIRRLDVLYDDGDGPRCRAPGPFVARPVRAVGPGRVPPTTSETIAGLLADADLRRGLTVVTADRRSRLIPGPEVRTLSLRDGDPSPD